MNVKLVLTDENEKVSDYKLKSESDEEISSYTVEINKEKALISYETNTAYRNQGYASLGLDLLKSELFKTNRTLVLELINLSGDYSRKVAENAGFFSPHNSINYFIALHPFAENIVEKSMQQFERGTPEYSKQERLLQRMRVLRKQQKEAHIRLANKLDSLKEEEKSTDDENYKKNLNDEIRHIERIFSNLPQRGNEETER